MQTNFLENERVTWSSIRDQRWYREIITLKGKISTVREWVILDHSPIDSKIYWKKKESAQIGSSLRYQIDMEWARITDSDSLMQWWTDMGYGIWGISQIKRMVNGINQRWRRIDIGGSESEMIDKGKSIQASTGLLFKAWPFAVYLENIWGFFMVQILEMEDIQISLLISSMEYLGRKVVSSSHIPYPILSAYFQAGVSFFAFSPVMSQSVCLQAMGAGKHKSVVSHGFKIQIPKFDNTMLIKGYSKTLIGRCLNPGKQDVKSLLYMMPRIWKMEDKIAGADLGLGRFQFDFDDEADIIEVLKMEPFHFDFWMVSLVRWKPVVDPKYPSMVTFWIRVMGIPLHFWAEPTFSNIGGALGEVKAVDIDNGRVQVVLDGFKPLVFETMIEFHSGEETMVTLSYERLFGCCRECFSLCHDLSVCPTNMDRHKEEATGEDKRDNLRNMGQGSRTVSYKGAVTGTWKTEELARVKDHQERIKGKGKLEEPLGEGNTRQTVLRNSYRRNDRRHGEASVHAMRPSGPRLPYQMRKREGEHHGNEKDMGLEEKWVTEGLGMITEDGRKNATLDTSHSAKKVRKMLLFEEDASEMVGDSYRLEPNLLEVKKVMENVQVHGLDKGKPQDNVMVSGQKHNVLAGISQMEDAVSVMDVAGMAFAIDTAVPKEVMDTESGAGLVQLGIVEEGEISTGMLMTPPKQWG